MTDPVLLSVAAGVCAVVGMGLCFVLVRLAANAVIVLIALGVCGFVVSNVLSGEWTDWPTACLHSVAAGIVGALLSLPALPFSSFYGKN